MAQTTYRFTFVMTFADYIALSRARESLGPLRGWGRPLRYPVWIAVFLATLWLSSGMDLQVLREADVLVWLLVIPIMIFAIDLFFRHVVYRWVFSRYAIANREAVVEVDQSGVNWTLGPITGAAPWASVTATVHTDSHAFLFLSKIEGITLPSRGLQEGDFAAFLDFVDARMSARGVTPPSA
ncbi:YcxB family protein [Phreatobacter aquaticus]|uniref:YcxB family protein n=1 Tax=Phreatobacter aquaticus TaxID=2570229 RepID=A0A4D7QCH9_9HYPH|nr:YcxB family protein [Phreatobacter aquaticus]QCK84878.1 YcxB family protein [Phreatobacter aquaticus]